MREQTWTILSGVLNGGDTKDFVSVSYARTVKIVTLVVSSAPSTGALTMQFKVNGTLNAQVFTLPQGQLKLQINCTGNGIVLAGGDILTVVLNAAIDALDLTVTIECEVSTTGFATGWYVPTIGTLQAAVASQEWQQFTNAAMSSGQSDPVPQVLASAVDEIITAIRTGASNNIGPAGSIPGGATNLFLEIAKYWLFKRISVVNIGDKQLAEMRRVSSLELEKIADGKRKFVEPSTVGEKVPSGTYGFDTYVPVDPFDDSSDSSNIPVYHTDGGTP